MSQNSLFMADSDKSYQHIDLQIGHINIYHLFNKIHDVSLLLNQTPLVDILGISETRLTSHSPKLPNYTFLRRDANFPGHTGMGVFIHNNILSHVKRRTDLELDEIECMWLELKQSKAKASLIGFVYRNPASHASWTETFINMMDKVGEKDPNILLLGDFNIDLLVSQNAWECMTSLFGLHQVVKDPTRVTLRSSTLIDHIYTNNLNIVSNIRSSDISPSDHCPILCSLSCKMSSRPSKGHTTIMFRSMKKFDETSFLNDLNNAPFSDTLLIPDASEALSYWSKLFISIIDKHAPLHKKRVKHATLPRWLSPEIIKAMKTRDMLKKSKQFNEYKKQRNFVKGMVRKAKKAYFEKLICNNNVVSSIWQAMNELTHKSRRNSGKLGNKFSAEDFNHHFVSLAEATFQPALNSLQDKNVSFSKLSEFCRDKLEPHDSAAIPELTTSDVVKLISQLKRKKSMGHDNINSVFLQIALPCIAKSLTYIYNLCLKQNIFPSSLKIAKVIPIPKNKNPEELNSFRPISLLSILSRPLEKHICNYLVHFIENHNLFHPFQSGFRLHHSCHTALTRMCDTWLSAINRPKPEITGAVFLDMKKAFDLVNHNILLKKLSLYFQNSKTLMLLESYLANRTQYVFLNGDCSSIDYVTCGVPQGSVLGPLLFNLFINDLPLYVSNPSVINDLFADDNSMHSSAPDIETVQSNLQQGLNEISDWCLENKMVLHPGKTKCMVIASRQKHQLTPLNLSLFLDSKEIQQVTEHRLLGVIIDEKLSWKTHIEFVCKQVSRNIYLLSQLSNYVSMNALKLFFHAHCMSHINYASSIWCNASEVHLLKLNSLHKRAAKIISDKPSLSTQDKLKDLQILPLNRQFDFNIAILMFKVKNSLAPNYLNVLLHEPTDRYGSVRYISPITRINLYKSSFSFSGPHVWNNLPNTFKNTASLQTFKSLLKRHMLSL
jgi:hypothetical protein